MTGCSSGIGLAVAVRLAKDELKRFKGERPPGPLLLKNIMLECGEKRKNSHVVFGTGVGVVCALCECVWQLCSAVVGVGGGVGVGVYVCKQVSVCSKL